MPTTSERRIRRARGWRLVRGTYWGQRWLLAGSIAGGLAWQLVGVAVPLVLGWAVERGVVDGDLSAAWWGGAALVALGIGEAIADAVRHHFEMLASSRAAAVLREEVAASAVDLDASSRDEWPAGQLVARATSDVDTVAESVESVGYTVAYVLTVPVIVALLVAIHPPLAAAVVAAVLATVVLTWATSSLWERREGATQASLAESIAAAEAALEGFKAIRGVGAEAGALESFAERSRAAEAAAKRTARLWIVFEPLLGVLAASSVVVVLWIGGSQVIEGALGLGDLVAAVGLALFLVTPVRAAGDGVVVMQRTLASASRLAEVPASSRRDDAGPSADGVTELVVDSVSFAVRAGQLAVVDGPVGSGKSSLLALLAGDRVPSSGSVTFDGTSLAAIADPRCVVLRLGPEPFLFAASVADNLRLGAPDATDEQLVEAASRSDALEFVDELDDGMQTVLADRGASLSGGQRQRIALARALLAGQQVLLLDGATSALEPHRELALIEALRHDRTERILVVSPTPGVRELADVVVDLRAPAWHGGGTT